MHSTLLIEIGAEDLPARYVRPLAEALQAGIESGLDKRAVQHGDARKFATPRRIAVSVEAVSHQQRDQSIERRGPPVAAAYKDGQPTRAAQGFAASCGCELADVKQVDGYLHFKGTQPGKPTLELIPEIFTETLRRMDELVPKRMRWGSGEATFVRPVSWLLALFGVEIIPLSAFGLSAGRVTYGHRFHSPEPISLSVPEVYEPQLLEAKVQADFSLRKTSIRAQVETQAIKLGGEARITDELLEEVTALVEWPVAISGAMEERFMVVPPEVIISTIEHNQRYFPVFASSGANKGKLLPKFIAISNIESHDPEQVISGNERVVRPRLSDALFFWEQDLKQPLAHYQERLATVTFLKGLGTLADKSERLRKLAGCIAARAQKSVAYAERAALLCKCDLVTRMVYEFTDLQGVIGAHYALKSGEPEAVADAIGAHYRPTQAGAPIPETDLGRIVAVADKLDSLLGIFSIGQAPTATKDPLSARRAGLGVLRILIEGQLDLDVHELLELAATGFPESVKAGDSVEQVFGFLVDRLRAYYLDRGSDVNAIEAALAISPRRPLDFAYRLSAVERFLQLPEAASLAAANKRIRNILKKSPEVDFRSFDIAVCVEPAETGLAKAVEEHERAATPLFEQHDYAGGLQTLAGLKETVDTFFDDVMVMAEDEKLRVNRIALLERINRLFMRVADISRLQA